MATEFIDPNGNTTTVWTQNSFTLIDDGVRQPTEPAISADRLHAASRS